MKSIKSLFSLRRHNSDGNIKSKHKNIFPTRSLTNLTNILTKKSKSVSLLKIDTVPTEHIKFFSDKTPTPNDERNHLKRTRLSDSDFDNNNTKRCKHQDEDITDEEYDNPVFNYQNNHRTVHLRVNKGEILGLEIYPKWNFSSDENTGYYIHRIVPGSAADKNRILQEGDEIVKVNGKKPSEACFLACNYFSTEDQLVEIIVKPNNLNASLTSDDSVFKVPNTTGMRKFMVSPSNVHLRRRKPQNYSERYCNLTGNLFVSVQMFKGPGHKPLGFSIVGGKGSPNGDIGIYIRKINDNGQAAEIGLRAGDQILTVQDVQMNGLTHEQALETFKKVKVGTIFIEAVRRSLPLNLRHSL